ncbi:MAG: HypC/HybG/HupF family hydrogenase formation chaperone [Elusimicrobiota bacterium]
MCLAIPMELVAVNGEVGTVRMGGVEKDVRLDLVDDPQPGEYVIVHAGFAIQKLDREQAAEDRKLIQRLTGDAEESA